MLTIGDYKKAGWAMIVALLIVMVSAFLDPKVSEDPNKMKAPRVQYVAVGMAYLMLLIFIVVQLYR